jgi:hypothetical protein
LVPRSACSACGIVSGGLSQRPWHGWSGAGRSTAFRCGAPPGGGGGGIFFSQVLVGFVALTFGISDALELAATPDRPRLLCGAISAAGSLAIARKGTPGLLEEAAAMQRLGGG